MSNYSKNTLKRIHRLNPFVWAAEELSIVNENKSQLIAQSVNYRISSEYDKQNTINFYFKIYLRFERQARLISFTNTLYKPLEQKMIIYSRAISELSTKIVGGRFEKKVIYCGQLAKVGCDLNCKKAWGSNQRPKVYNGINEIFHNSSPELPEGEEDDWAYLGDNEIGEDAPVRPGTFEGGQGKPVYDNGMPIMEFVMNKWCIRECERCSMSRPRKHSDPLQLSSFGDKPHRFRNMTKTEWTSEI